MRTIVIGARGSSLSLCQAQIVRVQLEEQNPEMRFAVKTIQSKADQHPEVPLIALGEEGVFIKELELALLRNEVDVVVHSMKDVPLDVAEGLTIAAVLEREDASDVLVAREACTLEQLRPACRIGTSSLRRKSQLLYQRRDIDVTEMRGNVDTRLRKLQEGQYDAIVLAACGLLRLGLEEHITQYLPIEQMLPEPGQGALGLEIRADDADVRPMVSALEHAESRVGVETERAFLRTLGGGCRVPIAAFAQVRDGRVEVDGAVIAPDGTRRLRERATGSIQDAVSLGEGLADQLIQQGANDLLAGVAQRS